MDLIWIAPGRQDGRVAIWDRDPSHPGGEIYLAAGDAPIQAARSPLVNLKLGTGALIEVDGPALADVPAEAPETPAEAPDPTPAPSDSGEVASAPEIGADDVTETPAQEAAPTAAKPKTKTR